MALRVEQLSLGPIGTNCYVVRAEATSSEAAVVDPSGDATELRLDARAPREPLAPESSSRTGTSTTCSASPTSPRERVWTVYMPEGERVPAGDRPGGFTPPGVTLRPYTPDVLLTGGETITLAGIDFEVLSVPGHSPAHVAYHADGCLFSGDVLFAGSVGRTDLPGADWETLLASIRGLVDSLPAGDGRLSGARRRRRRSAPSSRRNPFLAELRAERAG